MKKICVLGLGYIGFPTCCLLAKHGHQVIGVDVRSEVVDKVNRGEAPFQEPGLDELLAEARKTKKLIARTEPEVADVFLIAVPTPLDEGKKADLSYVKEAATSIVSHLRTGSLVILESTVPPGTSERLLLPIFEASGLKRSRDFYLAHCPERAIPGNTLYEMVNNDRVIGGIDRQSAELARELYSSFVKGNIFLTDLRTAEVIKLMENTYRDINIALANEFAQIAEETGLNIWEAIGLANKHPRVNILQPGPGVGGHCLAVDPWFLAKNSVKSRIISMAREINDSMPEHVLNLVKQLIGDIKGATIAVLGVAYKADVDDTREAPALKLIQMAEAEGFKVKAYDPWVKSFKYPLYSLAEAARDSDCIILITGHSAFKQVNPDELALLVRNKNLLDTRNILEHERWRKAGFKVKVLGDGSHQG